MDITPPVVSPSEISTEDRDTKIARMVAEHKEVTEHLLTQMQTASDAGKLYTLSVEEIQLIDALRKFKSKLTKVKVFTWMTCPVDYKGDVEQSV